MILGLVVRHVTQFVFVAALLLSLASMGLFFLTDEGVAFAALIASLLFSVWSIWKSEHSGFVRTKQMRRAFEPARHFNSLQVLTLVVLMMAQVGLASYFLIT